MPPTRPSHTIDALYAVGRNLVNFQRLEQILKHLALFAPICATPSTLQSVLETQKAKVARLTLGGAVKQWIENKYYTIKPELDPPRDDQITISFGFEAPVTPEYLEQLSGELELLAQERNGLIHLDLAQVNFGDEAECTELSSRLDAQNDRIIRAMKVLGPVLAQLRELTQLIGSDPRLIRELVHPTFMEEDAE